MKEWNNIGQADARTNVDISRYNLGIAQATHSDSKQMRSIAMLTMIFLPATFVAVSSLRTRFFFAVNPSTDGVVYPRPLAKHKQWTAKLTLTTDSILDGILRLEA